MLLKILKEIPDNRGKKGRQYENWAVLFIAILAMISGANSYRQIHTFTKQRLGYFKRKIKHKLEASAFLQQYKSNNTQHR